MTDSPRVVPLLFPCLRAYVREVKGRTERQAPTKEPQLSVSVCAARFSPSSFLEAPSIFSVDNSATPFEFRHKRGLTWDRLANGFTSGAINQAPPSARRAHEVTLWRVVVSQLQSGSCAGRRILLSAKSWKEKKY